MSGSISLKSFMLYVILILFAIAALLGILILKNWLSGKNASRSLAYSHGAMAAIALVLLLVYLISNRTNWLTLSTVLFAAAALIGFYLFFRDINGKMSATWIAVLHGVVALAGFLFLLLVIL